MGSMQFWVPQFDQYDPLIASTAYVSGIEGIPWAARVTTHDRGFSIQRSIDESGKLSIVWPNAEFGVSVLTTGSLRCQEEAYCLPLELARGTLHRVRQRAFEWQRVGLKIPDAYGQAIECALGNFIDAIVLAEQKSDLACEKAQASIDAALAASRPLCRAFTSQMLQFRVQQEKQLGTLLGVRLIHQPSWRQDSDLICAAVNSVCIHPAWHIVEADSERVDYQLFEEQIAWAQEKNLRVVCGPLVSLQPYCIPNWMHLLSDFDALYEGACQYVQKTVERFRGRVQIWNVGTGLNCPSELGLTDNQVLQLAVGIIQAARRADPKTPVTITMDVPWAEYLGQKENAISPLHFADALLRADLGLSGIGLELNLSCWPNGSLPRDLVDLSDMLDQWAVLGIPLVTSFCAPLSLQADPLAWPKSKLVGNWQTPVIRETTNRPDAMSQMANYAFEVFQMLLAKQQVHGVFWNQHSDRSKHVYPHCGLIDASGMPRPLLDSFIHLRSRYGQ